MRVDPTDLRGDFPADPLPLSFSDIATVYSPYTGRPASNPSRWDRIVRRIQIEGAELPVKRTNNARGGEEIDGPTHDLREHGDAHWHWLGAREPDGQAVVRVEGKKRRVRRVLWLMFRGYPPGERFIVNRTCDSDSCVNPWHAEQQTKRAAAAKEYSQEERAEIERLLAGLNEDQRDIVMGRMRDLDDGRYMPRVDSWRAEVVDVLHPSQAHKPRSERQ